MPRADITADYRSDAGRSNFPKLKLQTNEHARGVIVSKPIIEYVHWLEAPNIVNMAPTYKKIRDRDGQDRYVVDTRFVARPICSGVFETLRERGVDDKHCQACNMSRERPDIFRAPSPRYAANFLRYNLRPGGSWNDISSPFGVSALIWVFGGKVMDKLIDIRSMGPAYEDIRTVDLLLTCDDQNFQKPYSNGEFLPVAPAVWMTSDATRKYTAEYLAQNGASDDDLTEAIGRRVKEDWLADDISRVIQRWDVVRAYEARQGGAPVMTPGFGMESVQQGLGQVAQQFGQQQQTGGQPGYGQPGTGFGAPPGNGADPGMTHQPAGPSSGIDMSLLGVGRPPVPPTGATQAAPAQPAAPMVSAPAAGTATAAPQATFQSPEQAMAAMQQMQAAQIANPTVPAPAAPPAPTSAAAPGAAGAQGIAADLLAAVSAPAQPAVSSPSNPPSGLAGLQEFMAQTTSNPAPAPPAPDGPAAVAADVSQPQYTFEQLAKMGQNQ